MATGVSAGRSSGFQSIVTASRSEVVDAGRRWGAAGKPHFGGDAGDPSEVVGTAASPQFNLPASAQFNLPAVLEVGKRSGQRYSFIGDPAIVGDPFRRASCRGYTALQRGPRSGIRPI